MTRVPSASDDALLPTPQSGVVRVDTVIIGGGIAGMSCGRRLADEGRDFVMITDHLGGRTSCDPATGVNLGAIYVSNVYVHAGPYIGRRGRIHLFDATFFNDGRFHDVLSPRRVRHARALARVVVMLERFRRDTNAFHADCLHDEQVEVLARYPRLEALTKQSATDFLRDHGLERFGKEIAAPLVRGTLMVDIGEVNAFYLLGALLPLITPVHWADFSQTTELLTDGYQDRIVHGKVDALTISPHREHTIQAVDCTYEARNVVVATPAAATRTICPELVQPGTGVRAIPGRVLHVKGRRRREYRPGKILFMDPSGPVYIIVPDKTTGLDVVVTTDQPCDLLRYYETYEVAAEQRWHNGAIQISGARWRAMEPHPGVLLVGDHNVCGVEDSFITGLWAANRIAADSPVVTVGTGKGHP